MPRPGTSQSSQTLVLRRYDRSRSVDLRRPRPVAEGPLRSHRRRLHRADADPGRRHPARPAGQGRARHRPDRHRQDGVLRAADADAPRKGPRPRPHAAHADPRADARTRRAGRGELRQIRQEPQAQHRAADRRRFLRRAGQEARARRRRADRHARPPARPSRARQAAAQRRRDPRHRRSRPHARHGLHPRHRAHLRDDPVHPPDAVLLGHHAAGNHQAHRKVPARAGARRSLAGRVDRHQRHAAAGQVRRRSRGTSARRCAI